MQDPNLNTANPPESLTPHYYRDNFLRLCETVEQQYGDILNSCEQEFLQRFKALTFTSQCLYVRLISRTGPWFREHKLSYQEIDNLPGCVDELLQSNLGVEAENLTTEDLGQLYTKPELLDTFSSELPRERFSTKPKLLEAIEALPLSDTGKLELASAQEPGRIIAPAESECVAHLQIMFFGNRYQSLTQFVLQDMGVTRFYPYKLAKERRFFSCRDAFEEYLSCAALTDLRYELIDQGQTEALRYLAEDVLATNIEYASSRSRWNKLCNRLGRDLERSEDYQLALQVYSLSSAHPARERSARILEKTGALAQARTACEKMLLQPLGEEEQEAANRILTRVCRKIGAEKQSRRRDKFHEEKLVIPAGNDSVELCTAEFLAAQWHTVCFVENRLCNTLFGLAFWEEIFAPIPGVFHHPFQSIPSDMYDGSFTNHRQEAIAEKIACLHSGNLCQLLCDAYERYAGYQCRWVDWRYIDIELVSRAATIIPSAHLIAIWERILFDPQENRRGFPDLIALGTTPGDYCMIEVKGPGDTLQDNQKRWLRFFQAQNIPAQVAWVSWA